MSTIKTMKQSSIEWLIDQVEEGVASVGEWRRVKEKAVQMHKEEIVNAFNNGMRNSEDWFTDGKTEESEQYYQETYGDNNE